MNVHDIPMVFFTVVSQMAVGAFLVLGIVHVVARRRLSPAEADHLADPVLYAIGPILVVGLAVSTLHVNDFGHLINVIRHPQSSWLSREILFGVGFASVGFLFAVLSWFRIGGRVVRMVVGAVAAVFGILLVVAESMIYYSLKAVPAWHIWAVPFQFVATAVLLGAVVVGVIMMLARALQRDPDSDATSGWRRRVGEIRAVGTDSEQAFTAAVLRVVALVGAVAAAAILVVVAIYIGTLAQGGAVAHASAAILSGGVMWWRLALTGVTVILLGFVFSGAVSSIWRHKPKMVASLMVAIMVVAIAGEFLGRLLHYEAMLRVGI